MVTCRCRSRISLRPARAGSSPAPAGSPPSAHSSAQPQPLPSHRRLWPTSRCPRVSLQQAQAWLLVRASTEPGVSASLPTDLQTGTFIFFHCRLWPAQAVLMSTCTRAGLRNTRSAPKRAKEAARQAAKAARAAAKAKAAKRSKPSPKESDDSGSLTDYPVSDGEAEVPVQAAQVCFAAQVCKPETAMQLVLASSALSALHASLRPASGNRIDSTVYPGHIAPRHELL